MNTEVRVFAALHRLGADLGEPVEVEAPADGRVVVGGTGLPPARQAEIREALAAERDVRFHFADAPSAEPAAAAPTRVEAAHSPLEARLREYAGDDDRYQSLSDRVLDESDTVLAHAHALRTLELRFPAAREAELGAAERTMLHDMAAAHRGAFDQHARSLLGDITPLVKALGAPPLRGVQPGDLLDAAQRTDHALSAIFGAARTDLTPEQMVTELARAASALAAAVGEAQ